jgi:aconitate hydratase
MSQVNSFGSKDTPGSRFHGLRDLPGRPRVPGYRSCHYSLKVLLENLLRTEDGANVTKSQIEGRWDRGFPAEPDTEIQFHSRTRVAGLHRGSPASSTHRHDARGGIRPRGGDPKINPLCSSRALVIDHSVIADLFCSRKRPRRAMWKSSTNATVSATSSCGGARPH